MNVSKKRKKKEGGERKKRGKVIAKSTIHCCRERKYEFVYFMRAWRASRKLINRDGDDFSIACAAILNVSVNSNKKISGLSLNDTHYMVVNTGGADSVKVTSNSMK